MLRSAGRLFSILAVTGLVIVLVASCGGAGSSLSGGFDASTYDGAGQMFNTLDSGNVQSTCVPKSCQDQGFNCGPNSNGCGGPLMDCGSCPSGQTCGVGGFSKCGDPNLAPDGGPLCTPKTCADFPAGTCGQQADGCSGLTADCGSCTAPQYCGGGGPSLCGGNLTKTADGAAPCTPTTCAALGYTCGQASDGCGGTIGPCGSCTAPQYCGGGGANVCGGNTGLAPDGGALVTCTPKSCAAQGATCGDLGDGCGGTTGSCGTCANPQFCGGGGPNACGGNNGLASDGGIACAPKTCANYPGTCGPQSDGCGGMTASCGTCVSPQFCGGGGPSVCGGNNAMAPDGAMISQCVPETCASSGYNCGLASDGCGGTIGSCGTCPAPLFCGGGGANVCGIGAGDGGLVFGNCDAGSPTVVTGVAVAGTDPTRGFGNPDPIYDALVYIPATTPQPFAANVACTQCGAEVTGNPIVSTVTGPNGVFTLTNVPTGAQNLVIQLGRWRRMVPITVTACQTLQLGNVRMPRTQNEGNNGVDNIPLMAIATGSADPIECVLRKMGVEDSEFTNAGGTGRIQLWPDNGGTIATGTTSSAATLEGSAANLDTYDIVLLPCVSSEVDKTQALQQDVVNYANAGGRVFTTHYSYVWHISTAQEQAPPAGSWNANTWTPEAPWSPDPNQTFNPAPNDTTSITATVNQTFQKGKDFATWLQLTGATTTLGQIPLLQTRHDVDSPPAASALGYITFNTGTNHRAGASHQTALLDFTFDTPLPPATNQCGRVLFTDFHVNIGTPGVLEPNCANGACYCKDKNGNEIPLTAQERALEFSLFDIASCVTPSTCTPKTCANFPGTCGEQGDGCGGLTANCGSCPTGQTCGGAGVANQCGTFDAGSCTPKTCSSYPTGTCGAQSNGCGGLTMSCANCPSGTSCGGGGVANQCGAPTGGGCTPVTCSSYPAGTCGAQSDGCGGLTANCNPCTPPATCGGGGVAGQCGSPPVESCTPRTCANYPTGICGQQSDGCGGLTPDCNPCTPPDTCGGGGTPGQCGNTGNCQMLTCAGQGITCGPASDGCGGVIASCGTCASPATCGGAGAAGTCGGTAGCIPQTCQSLGVNCGPVGDGCGGVIDSCGTCTPPSTCGGGGTSGQCGASGIAK